VVLVVRFVATTKFLLGSTILQQQIQKSLQSLKAGIQPLSLNIQVKKENGNAQKATITKQQLHIGPKGRVVHFVQDVKCLSASMTLALLIQKLQMKLLGGIQDW
jgi:hypothetical protein